MDYNRFLALCCFPALIWWQIIEKCARCLILKILKPLQTTTDYNNYSYRYNSAFVPHPEALAPYYRLWYLK